MNMISISELRDRNKANGGFFFNSFGRGNRNKNRLTDYRVVSQSNTHATVEKKSTGKCYIFKLSNGRIDHDEVARRVIRSKG